MSDAAGPIHKDARTRSLLEGFGRFVAAAMTATIEHGPEVLVGLAELQVDVEYAQLLETEWARHPLLDFIKWQDASAGAVLAMTMPESAVAGHAKLAQLLHPACTAPATLVAIDGLLDARELPAFAVAEFRGGLACVRDGRRLDRAVTRLTIGLEGLLRSSTVSRGLLTGPAVRDLDSGAEIIKRSWSDSSDYKPYMKSWVFGMSNPYRHGQDPGAAAEQAMHAVCGTAIWAAQIMHDCSALDLIRDGLSREVTRQFGAGSLELQPTAEARVRRAAARMEKSATVEALLDLRDQLLQIRNRRRPDRPPTSAATTTAR